MITLLAAIAIGAALGFRFKVFVLVSAIAIGSITGLAMGIGRGEGIWSNLLWTLSIVTALQIGYFVGTVVNFVVVEVRRRLHSSIGTGRTRALT